MSEQLPGIALIGLPGSGKSTVGRQLARRLQLSFIDSDHEIEQRIGCSIREYFEREGEARFRDMEQEVIDALSQGGPGVLATGGGAVLRPANRQALHSRCQVVYLKSSPEELFRRLRHDVSRPLLQVEDPLRRLRDLFTLRDPLYQETAHVTIEPVRSSVPSVVRSIITTLGLPDVPPPATAPGIGNG